MQRRDRRPVDEAARAPRQPPDPGQGVDVDAARAHDAARHRGQERQRPQQRDDGPLPGERGRDAGASHPDEQGRQHLPPCLVGQERETGAARVVDGRERRHAPDASVDPPLAEREHPRQGAVDPAAPPRPAVDELLRVPPRQPRLALSVAELLPPVGPHRRPMVVPDERRRGEPDLGAHGLEPPADVDVVGRAAEDRVEPAEREERLPPEGHVAAGDMLGDDVVEHDVRRGAGRAGHALRQPRVVGRHHVGAAGAGDVALPERLHQVGQPLRMDPHVRVGVGDDLPGGVGQRHVPRDGQAAGRSVDHPHPPVPAGDGRGVVGRPVVDENDLERGVVERLERLEAVRQGVGGVVRADEHRHHRPLRPVGGRERRRGERPCDRAQGRLRPALRVDESERPVVDRLATSPPLVRPREGDRPARAARECRAELHRRQRCLPLRAFPDGVRTRLGQQQGPAPRHVVELGDVGAERRLVVQVDVEGADVEPRQIQEVGRRVVDVGDQRVGRGGLGILVELPEEGLDATVAVPTHDAGGDLVADGREQHGGMAGHPPHLLRHPAPDLGRQPRVVEKGDVLRPRDPGDHPQVLPRRLVEHRLGRRGVGADGVDAGLAHPREVAGDGGRVRVLAAVRVRRERPVRHALDQEVPAPRRQELPGHGRRWCCGLREHVRDPFSAAMHLYPRTRGLGAPGSASPPGRQAWKTAYRGDVLCCEEPHARNRRGSTAVDGARGARPGTFRLPLRLRGFEPAPPRGARHSVARGTP